MYRAAVIIALESKVHSIWIKGADRRKKERERERERKRERERST
jgi:hypothetical protein